MQLLQDAGITAGSFEAHTLLEKDVDTMIDADNLLREKLSKLISVGDSADR